MEIINNMGNDKYVEVFYDYFKKRENNEISTKLKNLSRDELLELILRKVKDENTEKALMCQIYAFGMKGVKFNNDIIKLANVYLTLYPQGVDLIRVLKNLAEAYISEYEIEKALEVCKMLNAHGYDYIHSIYCDCLYKTNRLEDAVKFLEKRLVIVKEKYGQEPDEKLQKLIASVANSLEKYKNYMNKGKVYVPATEKGRHKLGVEISAIKKTNEEGKPIKNSLSKYMLESSADTDTFVVFDFETTGFNAEWNEIIEIGAIKVVNGKVVDKFSTLVKPSRKISKKITEITGITNEMVADAPAVSSIISEFKDFIDGYDLVGHNVLFDIKFLDATLARRGKSTSCKIYDTLKLSKMYFKGMKSYKLTELSRILNIKHTNAHRALSDAEATAKLYMKCFKESILKKGDVDHDN
jgi:DNA polymerase III epsilon subunit family exonuclease